MAVIFEDDFEDGTLDAWGTSGSPEVKSDSPKQGTYYVRCYNTSTYSYDNLTADFTDTAEAYLRAYFKIEGKTGEYWDCFGHFATTGAVPAGYFPSTANASSSTMDLSSNGVVRATTSSSLSLDTWYDVRLRCKAAGASSIVELKIFGETLTDYTNFNGTANCTSFDIWSGCHNYSNRGESYDAVVVDDASYPALLSDSANIDVNDSITAIEYSVLDSACDVCEVKLGSVEDPESSSHHRVIYTYRKTITTSGTLNVAVSLYCGSNFIAKKIHLDVSSNDWSTGQFSLTNDEANLITDYTDLRLRFNAFN